MAGCRRAFEVDIGSDFAGMMRLHLHVKGGVIFYFWKVYGANTLLSTNYDAFRVSLDLRLLMDAIANTQSLFPRFCYSMSRVYPQDVVAQQHARKLLSAQHTLSQTGIIRARDRFVFRLGLRISHAVFCKLSHISSPCLKVLYVRLL